MGSMQPRKGASAERELFHILSGHLGCIVRRNVDQARSGGADGLDIPGFAVEVKRHETLRIAEWWEQAESQAESSGRKPILFYRQSRRPWRAVIDLADINPHTFPVRGATAIVEMDTAVQFLRESI